MSIDWTGSLCKGVQLNQDYNNSHAMRTMLKYAKQMVQKHNYSLPKSPKKTPFYLDPITCGSKQKTTKVDTSTLLLSKDVKSLQSKLRIAQYYIRIMDCTTLPGINDTFLLQSKATVNINKLIQTLFDCMHANPDAKIMFCKSNMIFKVHSNGSYLSVKKSRSRTAGYFYMEDDILLN